MPCPSEELTPPQRPSAGDVVLLVKSRMANASPRRLIVLLSESDAAGLRACLGQPDGVAERRPIAENILKTIQRFAPKCEKQGVISKDAAAHLLSWSEGSLPQKPRPTAYSCLRFRQPQDFPGCGVAVWRGPRRVRHMDLSIAGDGESDDDTFAEGALTLG